MLVNQGATLTPDEEMLTIPELAKLLKLSVGTVYNWQTRKYGPTRTKVGRQVRYRMSDVVAWMSSEDFTGSTEKVELDAE